MSHTSVRAALTASLLATASLAVIAPSPADAAGETFVVDTLSDNPAEGMTLREAVGEANAEPGPDTVAFADGLSGTITLTGGTISIVGALTIDGPGSDQITVDADGSSNIFTGSTPLADHAIRGLTLTNGSTLGFGGAVALSNSRDVLIDDVVFADNITGLDGGGLFVDGFTSSLAVQNSRFENNVASGTGGGLYANGGAGAEITLVDTAVESNTASLGDAGGVAALSPSGLVLIEGLTVNGNVSEMQAAGGALIEAHTGVLFGSSFDGNRAADSFGGVVMTTTTGDLDVAQVTATNNEAADTAGAAFFSAGDLRVVDTAVESNTSPGTGGLQVSATGTVEIDRSSIQSNDGDVVGGLSVTGAGELTITDTTISANIGGTIGGATIIGVATTTIERSLFSFNRADFTTGIGGGLWIVGGNGLKVENSTITNNHANQGGGIYSSGVDVDISHGTILFNQANDEGGGIYVSSADVDLIDTILSGNEAGTFPDVNDTTLEIDHSILGNGTGLVLLGSEFQVGVDPKVELIDDNGGPTRTIMLRPDSPAIDAAADKLVVADEYVDQRSRTRPGIGADIGAVETYYGDNRIWVPIEPARFVDTRPTGETIDGSFEALGRVGPVATLEVDFAGRGDVPANAVGVVANVTAVNPGHDGFLTPHPCGPQPLAASLNYTSGVTLGNEIILTFDGGTEFDSCIFTSGETDLTIDVVGYIPVDSGLEPTAPTRFLDTRADGATFDGTSQGGGVPGAGTITEVQIGNRGPVSASAEYAVVYVAAVNPAAAGFVTVWDCDGEVPLASSLNHAAGVNRGNEIVTRLGDDGEICLFTSADVQLTADVVGAVGAGTNLTMLETPSRLLDTRPGESTIDGVAAGGGVVGAGSTIDVPIAGRAGIFLHAETVTLNVTAIGPATSGFLTVYDCDGLPLASSLNYVPGVNGGNEIVASVNDDGDVCLFTSADTHLAVDVTGFTSP